MNFLFAMQFSSDFNKVLISLNYEKNYVEIRRPFHWSCLNGYHFARLNGNNLYEKGIKTYNFLIIP
jgi:hypothetical protein